MAVHPFDPDSRRQLQREHAASARKAAERARAALAGLDLLALKEALDDLYPDIEGPYVTLYTRMYRRALERRGKNAVKLAELLRQIDDMCQVAAVKLAELLRQIDDMCEVEGAAADAGFVLGFEMCRKLLLGELDLPVLQNDHGDET